MLAMRDRIWEAWAECVYWWRCELQRRQRRRDPFLESRPRICVSNLVMSGVIRSVAERLPCEVIVNRDNIVGYAAEFRDDPKLGSVLRDADRAWRFFWKGSRRFGSSTEIVSSDCGFGGPLRVKVAFAHEAGAVRMTISRPEEPAEAAPL
jgi:hypothetical protein